MESCTCISVSSSSGLSVNTFLSFLFTLFLDILFCFFECSISIECFSGVSVNILVFPFFLPPFVFLGAAFGYGPIISGLKNLPSLGTFFETDVIVPVRQDFHFVLQLHFQCHKGTSKFFFTKYFRIQRTNACYAKSFCYVLSRKRFRVGLLNTFGKLEDGKWFSCILLYPFTNSLIVIRLLRVKNSSI